MSASTAQRAGQRAVIVSLGLPLLGIVGWWVLFRVLPAGTAPIWVFVGSLTSLGLVGAMAGVVALVRGSWLDRLLGVVGILLSLLVIVMGTSPLWLPPICISGFFPCPAG